MMNAFRSLSYLRTPQLAMFRSLGYSFSSEPPVGTAPPYPGYNINQQQHRAYITKVRRQQAVEQLANSQNALEVLPRRKRRIYDKPRIDTDITDFSAWRVFGHNIALQKSYKNGLRVLTYINVAPKWLRHAFGLGNLPSVQYQRSTAEYYFEDNNLSQYLLYDQEATTQYKPNDPNWNYEDQSNIEPRKRKIFRPTPEEFWNSEEPHPFKLNGSTYAEHHKFKKWLESEIERRKTEKSYDEFVDELYGRAYTFNKLEDKQFFKPKEPMIMYASPKYFEDVKPAEKIKEATKKKSKKEKNLDPTTEKAVETPAVAIQAEPAPLPQVSVEKVTHATFKFASLLSEDFRTNENVSALGLEDDGKKKEDKKSGEEGDEEVAEKKGKGKKEKKAKSA